MRNSPEIIYGSSTKAKVFSLMQGSGSSFIQGFMFLQSCRAVALLQTMRTCKERQIVVLNMINPSSKAQTVIVENSLGRSYVYRTAQYQRKGRTSSMVRYVGSRNMSSQSTYPTRLGPRPMGTITTYIYIYTYIYILYTYAYTCIYISVHQ